MVKCFLLTDLTKNSSIPQIFWWPLFCSHRPLLFSKFTVYFFVCVSAFLYFSKKSPFYYWGHKAVCLYLNYWGACPGGPQSLRLCLSAKTYFPLYFILCAYLARNSGVARQFCARGRTMKLAPLPGLFFHIFQIHRLRF